MPDEVSELNGERLVETQIGAKSLANGNIELKPRSESDPKKAELVPVADAVRVIEERVKAATSAPATK